MNPKAHAAIEFVLRTRGDALSTSELSEITDISATRVRHAMRDLREEGAADYRRLPSDPRTYLHFAV
jgi:transcription initiation factor IIE alpha subunit